MLKVPQVALVALLVLCMSAVGMAQSQATTGQIVGTVKNPAGEVIPGATVKVTNTENGQSQTLTTNDEGGFRAVSLQPGNYSVNVTAQGFGDFTQTGYQVEVGSSLDANIEMQVGAVNAEVLVTSASVETTQAQTTTNINEVAITDLPINGRRFQDFVLLTPTADVDPVRQQISLVGQRGINANVQIDGADYNNPFFGGIRGGERSNNAFTFPQSAIKEFQVVPSGYNAEFGRSTGGIVNAVTKSGTNEWHGSGFFLARPEDFATRNEFEQIASPSQRQYGGSIGGPIVKNKAFFFFAAEFQKFNQQRIVQFNGLVSPNTPGVTEALTFYRSLEGPYTQTNDAQAYIGRFDYNFNESNLFNVRYNYSKNTALNAVTAGTQLQPNTNSALSNNGTEGDSQHTVVGQLTTFFSPTVVNELRAQYSRENRPRLANEFSPLVSSSNIGNFGTVSFLPTTQFDYRVQIADNITWNRGQHSFKFGGEYNHTFADQFFAQRQAGNFDTSLAGIDVLRALSVGSAATGDPANRFDNSNFTYRRNIGNGLASLTSDEIAVFAQDSWRIRPNFTLNFGLRWEAQYFSQPDTSNETLTNLVANTNFPLGRIDPRDLPDQTNQFAPRFGFAWDPWSDGKTVIRGYSGLYFARTPLLPIAGAINNFRSIPGDVQVQLSGFTTACSPTVPNSSPLCPSTIYKQFLTIGIDLNAFELDDLPILTPDQLLQIAQNVATARGQSFSPLVGQGLVTVGEQLRNPRSFQFGFAFEREFRDGLTIGAQYDQVRTWNLMRNRDIDLPTPFIRDGDLSLRPFFGIGAATPGAFTRNRPLTALGNAGFLQVRESSGQSLYQALTVRAQMRRRSMQFDAFYTFGRNLDDDTSERNATFAEYDNSFDLQPEYNYSRSDRRHQFVFNTVINMPYGFEVSATGRMRSGLPVDPTVSNILAPTDFATNIVGRRVTNPITGETTTVAFSAAELLNLRNGLYAAAVTLAPPGTTVNNVVFSDGTIANVTPANTTGDLNQDRGNSSNAAGTNAGGDRPFAAPGVSFLRNSFRNRPTYNVDLRVQKEIVFREKYRLIPSLEFFNVLGFDNIEYLGTRVTNYGNPGVNERTGAILAPSNPDFLKIRDAQGNYITTNRVGQPFAVQAGIRFLF
jgi:Carboxypeptidase regulatory-like domain